MPTNILFDMSKISFLFFLCVCLILVSSCGSHQRRIKLADSYAEGVITDDTTFIGTIKFYDLKTNKLTEIATYDSGVLNGQRIVFYPNGKTKAIFSFEHDKDHGENKIYDTSGAISLIQYSYHGLRVGPSIKYKYGDVKQYYFYSLDKEQLINIDYDSISDKSIEQINDGKFIFWHTYKYSTAESDSLITDLFIYLPNPPSIKFKYSLCIVDNAYDVKSVVKEFNSGDIWETCTLDYSFLKSNQFFAIRLRTETPFGDDKRNSTMFKKL